jgi:hypothetical protein
LPALRVALEPGRRRDHDIPRLAGLDTLLDLRRGVEGEPHGVSGRGLERREHRLQSGLDRATA